MTASGCATSPSAPVEDGELTALFVNWKHFSDIALAVSGGADSIALLRLAHAWTLQQDCPPHLTILTVDHGLRAASPNEAAWVNNLATALGLPHYTLVWEGEKPKTGVQAKARAARYALMTAFARANAIPALATAHTADDQAETFLMRLARGSGLDGLAGMSVVSALEGVTLLRPFLGLTRARLVASLNILGQPWIEDPSNDNTHYERVRIRQMLRQENAFNVRSADLALTARRLRRARDAIEAMADDFLSKVLTVHEAGFGKMAFAPLLKIPEEVALKVLGRLAHTFSGKSPPIRMSKLEACYTALAAGGLSATLGGCRFLIRRGSLIVAREFGRMTRGNTLLRPEETLLWDGRFSVHLPPTAPNGVQLRVLGPDGIAVVNAAGGNFGDIPRVVVQTLPSLWRNEQLTYAPFVMWENTAPENWLTVADCRHQLNVLAHPRGSMTRGTDTTSSEE
jgi:tRNA(Ile)-lysidine synthase